MRAASFWFRGRPPGAPSFKSLQLDGDSVGRLSRSVLFRVLRGAGGANVVRLRARLVIQVDDYAVQDVFVHLALLMGAVVDAEDAHLFVLELDLVVPGIYRRRIEWSHRCFACGRAFQVDLENANRMIADVLGDVGAARRPPANIAAAEFDAARLVAFLASHHAVVKVDQHTIRGMSVLRHGGRPRLECRHDHARLRCVESRRNGGRRQLLSRQNGHTCESNWTNEPYASHQTVHSSPPIRSPNLRHPTPSVAFVTLTSPAACER